MKKYKVLIDTLNHNGRRRVPDELIELSEADAEPLLKVCAVKAIAEARQNDDPDAEQLEVTAGKKDRKTKDK